MRGFQKKKARSSRRSGMLTQRAVFPVEQVAPLRRAISELQASYSKTTDPARKKELEKLLRKLRAELRKL